MTKYFLASKHTGDLTAQYLNCIDYPIPGQFPILIPDGVSIEAPVTDLVDLETKLGTGLIALYPDLPVGGVTQFPTPTTVIDVTDPGHFAELGAYEVLLKGFIGGTPGMVTGLPIALGTPATLVVAYWHVYQIDRVVNDLGSLDNEYVVKDPTDVLFELSVDGGANWDTPVFGDAYTPTVAGSSLVIRVTNSNVNPIYLGAWGAFVRL